MDFTPWCTLPGKTSTRPASPAPVKASREFTITKMGRNRNNTSKITSPLTRPRTDIDRSPVDRSAIVPLPGYKHLIVFPFSPPYTKGFRYRLLPPQEIAVKNVLYCKYRICFLNKLQRGKYFDTFFVSLFSHYVYLSYKTSFA